MPDPVEAQEQEYVINGQTQREKLKATYLLWTTESEAVNHAVKQLQANKSRLVKAKTILHLTITGSGIFSLVFIFLLS